MAKQDCFTAAVRKVFGRFASRAKVEALRLEFDAWEETTVGADFPA